LETAYPLIDFRGRRIEDKTTKAVAVDCKLLQALEVCSARRIDDEPILLTEGRELGQEESVAFEIEVTRVPTERMVERQLILLKRFKSTLLADVEEDRYIGTKSVLIKRIPY
jgi:hypothetical protein